jgi:hypothetical protein
MLGLLMIIWPVSYSLNLARGLGTGKLTPSDSIPLIFDYRLGAEDGAVWIYNQNMPYTGGIIGLASTNDPPPINKFWGLGSLGFRHEIDFDRHGKISMTINCCDLPGIYFRQFWVPDQGPAYTTLSVSLCYPFLLSAILPLYWIYRKIRLRRN